MTERLSPRDILTALVSFPTVSRDTNLPLIDWVEAYLTSHGITCHRQLHATDDKAALFAHVGPIEAGGVVLSGHTDVVPIDGQDWTSDPFTVIEKDGKLFGRGTTDMKGFDALAIWAMVEAQHRGVTRPLQLALSYDEEIGCTGAEPLIEAMHQTLPKASAVIVGEPSMMKAVTGHKGGTAFRVHVIGHEVHSSILHTGVSAIMSAAKLINWANEVNAESAATPPSDLAAPFDPPWTSCHVGTVTGGTARNITARDCWFDIEFRVVPGETADAWADRFVARVAEVEAEMQAVHPDARIELDRKYGLPPLAPEAQGEAEAIARRMTGDNSPNVVSYGTEGGHFQNAGYSVVVCGPGDIAQAHQPDEYITLAQFAEGQAFMERLLTHLRQ